MSIDATARGIAAAAKRPLVRKAGGLSVKVDPHSAGGFKSAGGTLSLVASGTWYVGTDLLSGALIALPRLGHRGWVPVAKVVTGSSAVASIDQIDPVLPKSRLPRFVKKLKDGQATNVLVLGSSLAEGTGTDYWSGMLFNASSSVANYRVPGTMTFNNFALGGTPNQYQLAQLGLASAYQCTQYNEAGFPNTIGGKTPPNGRSTMFTGVDLVVVTLLANGGDYRLQCLEPIIRQLRKLDIEVIITTDNPQGAAQVGGTGPYIWAGGYQSVTSAGLYVDGPELMRIADQYNCELADTAAYVAEAALRYPTASIYRDSIHMYAGQPNGRIGQPSGGYEVYARAIRSCIPVDSTVVGTVTLSTGFDTDGVLDGWYSQGTATLSVTGGSLIATNANSATQFGAQILLPGIKAGDTVRVQGTRTNMPGGGQVGLQGGVGGGWASTTRPSISGSGAFDFTLTASRDAPTDARVLLYGGSGANDTFSIGDVTITVNSTYEGAVNEPAVREYEPQRLPSSRIVTDTKTPGGTFVILPKDERYFSSGNGAKGSLGASPLGSASFARRFSSAVGAAEDLLTLTTGQRACISALGVVGTSLIYYSVNGDPAVTFDLIRGGSTLKSMTIPAQTITREIYFPLFTPTQKAKGDVSPSNDTVDIVVTSGTLRIAALVALTFDLDLLAPEAASRIGTWTAKVTGGSPNMPGYGTDTANDYAVVQCPPSGRRVSWIISSKPNSKPIDTWSGRTITAAQATVGVNHVRTYGNHIGPGEFHYIKLTQANAAVDQATNGYGLHIGGIIIVNDR